MIDEGYTKFTVDWADRAPLDCPQVGELERWRRPLYVAGLVGHYAELRIGYGNISLRTGSGRQFVITGTQTGHLPHTGNAHYALVTDYDIDGNFVSCRGAVQASSETLTHAAIYELDASIYAVVHVHDRHLWERLKDREPVTRAEVAYGTPAMAREFGRLFHDTDFATRRLAAMAGHDSGIVAIGRTLREAATRVIEAHEEFSQRQPEETG